MFGTICLNRQVLQFSMHILNSKGIKLSSLYNLSGWSVVLACRSRAEVFYTYSLIKSFSWHRWKMWILRFSTNSFSSDVLRNWLSSSAHRKRNSAGIWFLRNFSAEWNKLASGGLKLHLYRLFFKSILLWILKIMSWSCVLCIKEEKSVLFYFEE